MTGTSEDENVICSSKRAGISLTFLLVIIAIVNSKIMEIALRSYNCTIFAAYFTQVPSTIFMLFLLDKKNQKELKPYIYDFKMHAKFVVFIVLLFIGKSTENIAFKNTYVCFMVYVYMCLNWIIK